MWTEGLRSFRYNRSRFDTITDSCIRTVLKVILTLVAKLHPRLETRLENSMSFDDLAKKFNRHMSKSCQSGSQAFVFYSVEISKYRFEKKNCITVH